MKDGTMNARRGEPEPMAGSSGTPCARAREIYRDPALWVWLVVLLLAMLPVKAAIGA
jgi:hypothetical protein